ncbi:MAG: hypothetical protein DWQ36_17660 [Acidobacteria bacterium]|nr:MAG: hypothetical protein DWQ30_15890 [Acidobacteriota bacterium]REK04268.1 MAG: hypothetical protein DWQ36_17660 [Acidobacteriota bacterium]
MPSLWLRLLTVLIVSVVAVASASPPPERPDLTGHYDSATITPMERPRELGDQLYMTPEEAERRMRQAREFSENAALPSDPGRDAPEAGGAAPVGFDDEQRETLGAGNVGGYNWFWVDRGEEVFTVDGKFRTSILVDPEDGRYPPMTEAAIERIAERRKLRRPNDGTAWWLDVDGPGPYDGPESLGIPERCLLGFTGAAPMLPGLYNNHKAIVQTDEHVMILIEMVHDARIVRMNSEHPPADQRFWLGDSIGWWEGDTLVVDTTNFHPLSRQAGGSEDMHLVERFTKMPDGNLLYRFTVTDESVWTEPWTGEYVWRSTDEKIYEYACHEGNYAMEGILKGARLLEREYRESGDSTP